MSPRRAAVLLVGTCLTVLLSGTTATWSSWTTASIGNQTNEAASGSLAFVHTYPSGSCSAGARTSGTLACAGIPAPTGASTGSDLSAVDTVANAGTLLGGQLVSEFRATSCAPVQLANAKTAADPMLPRLGTAFGATDPWGTAGAVTFSSGGYAAEVSATNTGSLLGSSYSLGVWFKVANGYSAGGPLMGLALSPVNASSAASSPVLWMDTAGKIRFRVTGTLGTSSSGVSAAAYNDGAWHLVVLSVAATLVSTPTLYVDSAAGVTGLGLAALTGGSAYWHLGWADFTGIGGAPAATLPGSLAGAFVTTSTVSSATRTALLGTASASAYATAVQALTGIAQFWPLTDPGTTTYTGTLPVIGATPPCSMLDLTWTTASPAGTITAATTLAAFADGTWHAVPAPTAGASQTATFVLARDPSWNSFVAGLRLYLPLAHRIQAAPAGGGWQTTFSWAGSGAVVLG